MIGQVFVGNQFAYDKYRDLRLEKNLAQGKSSKR
jgi:hypothetical protein